jgi:hypothetical protein
MNNDLQGFNLSEDDSTEERLKREAAAKGVVDGRTMRRRGRDEQVALKTTLLKRQQLQRLALLTNKSQVEVFEAALDAYERELKKSGKR